MIKNTQDEIHTELFDDYQLLSIDVDVLAKLKLSEHIDEESGEVTFNTELSPLHNYKRTKIIIAPDGNVVYPQSLYLVYKLRGEAAVKDTNSIAKALLMFTRYLDSTHHSQYDEDGHEIPAECLTYKTLTEIEEEGAPWQFAEFLSANCRHANSSGDEALALSTARTYMGAVIGFYKWMQRFGYLKRGEQHVVTHYEKKEFDTGVNQHDKLAHIKKSTKRVYEQSNIMKMFPNKDATPAYKKLKPMTFDHRKLFDEYVEFLPKPFPLMFKLVVEAGLRVDELTHFPAHEIGDVDYSGNEVVPINITKTKGAKPRTIEIPISLYEELEQYKQSIKRGKNLKKRNNLIESGEESDLTEYLFISNKGKQYSENTLEKHFASLRQLVKEVDPSWYYRIHDGRATYATHWLWNEYKKRGVDYNYLMDELAELMGHYCTSVTEKYIRFMEKRDNQLSVAKRKNNKISGGW
ncbi:tyrosine-type recombinase/integrase [Pseudoalteromonas arctica]|uniref:tyrosine-type recombinase/integrase n=1 Tax=Pseudoalteromonas arctica TaxID=394751 RepID=UPI001B7D5764